MDKMYSEDRITLVFSYIREFMLSVLWEKLLEKRWITGAVFMG